MQLLEEANTPRNLAAIENYTFDYDPIVQQDLAPPHFYVHVREYLEEFLGRWIVRRVHIEWPPRSPDLALLFFFLWTYVRKLVFLTIPANLQELLQLITDVCATIPPEILTNIRRNLK